MVTNVKGLIRILFSGFVRIFRPMALEISLGLSFLLIYCATSFPCFPLVGDAADYCSLSANANFGTRTLHIGFYLVYSLIHLLNRLILDISPAMASNLFTAAVGAASIPILFLIVNDLLTGDKILRQRIAIISAIVYGSAGLIWYHALFAEVQALMLCLLYGSMLCFIREKYLLAGTLLAFSALVSQACAPAGLWFFGLALHKQVKLKSFAYFAISFAVTMIIFVAPIYEDYLWGPRGIINAHSVFVGASLSKTTLNLAYTLVESFWPLLLLVPFAARTAIRQKAIIWLVALPIIGFLYVGPKLGHVEYGFLWMPYFLPMSIIIAIGLNRVVSTLSNRWNTIVVSLVLAFFVVANFLTYIRPKYQVAVKSNQCLVSVYEIARSGYIISDPYCGFVYANKFWPDSANVFESPWTMLDQPRDTISSLLDSCQMWILDYIPPPHFLKHALLTNPVADRLITPEQRRNYLDLDEVNSVIFLQNYPTTNLLEEFQCDHLRLYRIVEKHDVESDNHSGADDPG